MKQKINQNKYGKLS